MSVFCQPVGFTTGHKALGWAGRRAARDPTAAAPGAHATTLLERVWLWPLDAGTRRRPPPRRRRRQAQPSAPAGIRGRGGASLSRGDAVGGRGGGEWSPMWSAAIIVGRCRAGPQHTWTPSSSRCFAGGVGGIPCACRAGGVPVSTPRQPDATGWCRWRWRRIPTTEGDTRSAEAGGFVPPASTCCT